MPPPSSFGPPPGASKKPPSSRAPLIVVLLGAVVALAIVGYSWWKGRQAPAVAPPPPPAAPVDTAPDASIDDVPPPLPPLAESDARVRELVGLLSSLPELQKWLSSTEDLVRRFSSAVSNIAEGQSPRSSLSFMAPVGDFQVIRRERRLFIAPESFARYDGVTRVLTSLDTSTSAITYKALRPLIQGAYLEISRPGQRFDQTLSNAIQHMLDTPVPEGDVEVVDAPGGVNFNYASEELEGLSAAQKHLVRMGPTNARAIQAKLRELRDALALPPPDASP
ncbi:hypothetical protein BON30_27220 [Cystobacter ferrugineus]|uniref:DUF3014 domain-containing protein n=2 Tax=Cystobacter ferrugineus TaxID=83449 RepID=A0A1L9B6L5_9BACT|nr:hypothetical protein BON30_27220 [Cystobacter ferrugineus]